MAQASAIQDRPGLSSPRRHARGHAAPPRLHLGRLAILVLVLIGASFYVSPLRDFFVQQDRYQKEAATLQAALNARAVIDQAVGILMSRAGYSADEAFDRLRHMSQTQNTKLAVVARSIVDEAVRRARSRHTGGSPRA